MISVETINKLVNEVIDDKNMFVVDITVGTSNVITILIDSHEKVTVEDCIKVSRYVENNLDREEEDFELHVSSSGLDQPFKVFEQYKKNIGNDVEVVLNTGIKIIGVLASATNENVIVKEEKMERIEGKKKKQKVINDHDINLDNIKTIKVNISFK